MFGVATAFVAATSCGLAACSDASRLSDERVASVEQRQQLEPLLAPQFCKIQVPRLAQCALPPIVGLSGPTPETAVPLRTIIETVSPFGLDKANCSTGVPMELTLAADNMDNALFRFIRDEAVILRRRDRGIIQRLDIRDSAPQLTDRANFQQGCGITLRFRWNEPDVNSREEAQEILDRLQADVDDKRRAYENAEDVTAYESLFSAYEGVLQSFYTDLTAGGLQEMRANADAIVNTAFRVEELCGSDISAEDRSNLMTLVFALGNIQGSTQFTLPDGGTKSLADVLAERAPTVRATVERLRAKMRSSAGDGGANADTLRRAAEALTAAESRLSRARAQLASFFPGGT